MMIVVILIVMLIGNNNKCNSIFREPESLYIYIYTILRDFASQACGFREPGLWNHYLYTISGISRAYHIIIISNNSNNDSSNTNSNTNRE